MRVIGILENMSGLICPHCGEKIDLFSTGGGERTAREMGVPFLGKIPIRPEIVASTDQGQPYVLEDGKEDFSAIIEKLINGGTEK
jgi:MinD superfamily P-loop ATPase